MEFLNLGIYFIVELVFIVLLVLADGLKLLPVDLLSFLRSFLEWINALHLSAFAL